MEDPGGGLFEDGKWFEVTLHCKPGWMAKGRVIINLCRYGGGRAFVSVERRSGNFCIRNARTYAYREHIQTLGISSRDHITLMIAHSRDAETKIQRKEKDGLMKDDDEEKEMGKKAEEKYTDKKFHRLLFLNYYMIFMDVAVNVCKIFYC